MFRNKSTNKKEAQERVIIGEEIIDISFLRTEAKRAGTRFWVMLVLVSLLSSLVVPYLSMASIAASDTKVFTGDVIPGYSMGGIAVSSYGVDINSWGQSAKQSESSPAMVKSTYGYWTEKRAKDASNNLVASQRADKDDEESALYDYEVDDKYLSPEKKARGWIGITRDDGEGDGLSDFAQTGSGQAIPGRTHYSEDVAPYRTQADWQFWDSQSVGGATPSIITTVYPDFVIFGWDAEAKTARTLTNPDDIQNLTNSESSGSGAIAGTAAVPHYVPLSTLFEEFGLGDSVMNKDPAKGMNDMDSLFAAIMKDAQDHDGKSPILNKIVENKGHDARYDLMIGTHYENLNGANKSSEGSSDAWNPYPYSMVFKGTSNGATVVSSIYNNTEAYVYFSPQSAYNNYMNLRSEYDDLVNASARQVADAEPQAAFQLGYYLAGMSILEAYLNEALPQDMTRGYVGPAEGNPIANSTSALANASKLDPRSGSKGTVSDLFSQSFSSIDNMVSADGLKNDSAIGFRSVPYSQLMYDFADAAIVKYDAKGEGTWLGATSALMNTLSTYGYGVRDTGQNTNTDKTSAGQGPNRGMTRRQNMARVTAFGPYTRNADSLKVSISEDKDDPLLNPGVGNAANTGMYVPVYYPIQQHEMSTAEMQYRFQVLSLIPYNTLTYEIGKNGFDSNIAMSYQNNALASLDPTKEYYSKVASLGKQLDELNKATSDSLGGYNKGKSIVLNPQTNSTSMVGDRKTVDYARNKDTTERVDNALMSFQSGLMNSDNVHDLVDIIRAIPGVKYETFIRYYNPIKSSGGADDFFLTRITPAQTTFMPSVLTAGYECAGGTTNNENIKSTTEANFDYFSVPSFAPCFAAKTAEDTYYGVLNYELRPFYTSGFLSTLPADSNIPALEKYEEMQEEMEEESVKAIEGMKTKILTIYILAKRLAFATAYGKLVDAKGADGFITAGGLYYANKDQSSLSSGTDDVSDSTIRDALKPTDPGSYTIPENDNGQQSFGEMKREGMPDNADVVGTGDNRIDTDTLSDGTEFGVSDDGTQVSVNGSTYTIDPDTHQGNGVSPDQQAEIDHAFQQQQADEAEAQRLRDLAASLAAGGSYWTGVADWGYLTDTRGDGTPGPTATVDISGLRNLTNNLMGAARGILAGAFGNGTGGGGGGGGGATFSSGTSYPPIQTASGTHPNVYNHYGRILLGFLSGTLDALMRLFAPTVAEAAESSDAEKVYVDDKLEARGYIKAADSDWSQLSKSMKSAEGITFHVPSGTDLPTSGDFDYGMQEFGQKHILGDDLLNKKNIWCKTSDGYAFVTDLKTVFSALYNDAYTHFLTPAYGDSYYWDTPAEIAKYDVTIDEGMTALNGENSQYNTVGIAYSDATNVDKAKQDLDEYCEEAFADVNAIIQSLRMLNDSLPKQMQNVLAWADVQAASESETNYQTSPDDRVLEIKLGVKETGDTQAPALHNLYDAQKMGFQIYDNDGDYALVEDGDSPSANIYDSDMQARTVRGVAGTTAIPSEKLAAYTISATVARIDRLAPSSASSSSIPYAGIYTGNLNSGTDKYALIQAHTIDRQSISSGLSGDLKNSGTETSQVGLANASSDNQTQQYLQAQNTFVTELNASVVPNATEIMTDAMARTMPSASAPKQGIESVNASTNGIGFPSLFASPDGAQQALAKASTFENATMNRQSATSQKYNTSSRQMVYQSGGVATASASAITTDRQWAESLVDGTFSDTYALIQSVALMMVLAFLMIIAFQNFVGYTSGKEEDYISAQTKLKTVLPRALIAVAMIGLPPMGGNVGFQGGCFLLLQLVNAMTDAVVGSFTGGTDMFNQLMSNIAAIFTTNFNILEIITQFFDILVNLLAAAIFLVGSIFVVLLCLVTDVVLFLFWMLGPLVWAFYVWPYDASEAANVAKAKSKTTTGLLGKVTGYMGMKSFTNGEVGRDAPTGWVMGYLTTLSTVVVWNIMFWIFSLVLTMMREGTSLTDAMDSLAHAADIDVYNPGSAGDVITGQAPQAIPDTPLGHLLLALLFIMLVYVMYRVLKNNMGGALKMMYGTVGFAAKVAKTVALGHVAAAAKSADFAAKAGKAMDAAGKADSFLGKAVNVGAKGLDGALHGIGNAGTALDNVINSPAASDVGNRVNSLIDNLSKDVADRDDSSGAFDGIISTVPTYDEDGKITGSAISLTPAVAGAGSLAKRQVGAYKKLRAQHGKNKVMNALTELADKDNAYMCLERSRDIQGRLAQMGGGATVGTLAADVKSRLAQHASGKSPLGASDMEALRNDAALLGIEGTNFDALASGDGGTAALDAQMRQAVQNTREIQAIGASVKDPKAAKAQHDAIDARRNAIISRAGQIDGSFGKQVSEHCDTLWTASTKGQMKARRAQTLKAGAKAQAKLAGHAVSGGEVAAGGRLGETPKSKRGPKDRRRTLSRAQRDAYDKQYASQKQAVQDIKELERLATKDFDAETQDVPQAMTPTSDADRGALAASATGDEFAAMDRLAERESDSLK